MGWTFTSRNNLSVKDFLRSEIEQDSPNGKRECLDIAIVERKTAYIACRVTRPGLEPYVAALVFLLEYRPKNVYDIGYKNMDESMGPCEKDCPERILKLLTPLPEGSHAGYSAEWRAECWQRVAHRKAMSKAETFHFMGPVRFSNGAEESRFRKTPKRNVFVGLTTGGTYRLSKSDLNEAIPGTQAKGAANA